jgi:predicted ATP-binding protein involved in virulence
MDIHNEASHARLAIQTRENGQEYQWAIVRSRKGRNKPDQKSDYENLNEYTRRIRLRIEDSGAKCDIPLFVYYPVNRSVLDIPLRIRTKHNFDLLEAYDGSLTSGADFRTFFEWFRNREDLENENRKYLYAPFRPEGFEFPDRQLQAVRTALNRVLPEYSDFSVRRNPLRMAVLKSGREFRIDQLSDGEKCLIAMVGDLARRLAIANPLAQDPLHGTGIVLIDEIDLHLHPAWQRMVPGKLVDVFPNCQFVLSTHSPQVIGEIESRAIRILLPDEALGIKVTNPNQAFGLTSNDILDEIMLSEDGPETLTRNPEIEKQIHRLFEIIDEEDFPRAQDMIEKMKRKLGGDTPDLIRAEGLIAMLEEDWSDE